MNTNLSSLFELSLDSILILSWFYLDYISWIISLDSILNHLLKCIVDIIYYSSAYLEYSSMVLPLLPNHYVILRLFRYSFYFFPFDFDFDFYFTYFDFTFILGILLELSMFYPEEAPFNLMSDPFDICVCPFCRFDKFSSYTLLFLYFYLPLFT